MPNLCQTNTQLPLVGLEAEPSLQPSLKPLEGMAVSAEDLKRRKRREYIQEWYRKHPEKSREYYRNYWREHGDEVRWKRQTPEGRAKIAEVNRKRRAKCKEEFAQRMKEWYQANQDYVRAYRKKYLPRRRELYQLRKEEITARKRELSHTDKYRAAVQAKCRRYRQTDIQFALKDRIRASVNRALRRNWVRKSRRTMEMVGCSVDELKAHIERQFTDGMSWQNRSTWHVDHFVPIVAFDLTDPEEQKWAFNWRNLRPLAGHENHVKADTIPDPIPDWLPLEIRQRIITRK